METFLAETEVVKMSVNNLYSAMDKGKLVFFNIMVASVAIVFFWSDSVALSELTLELDKDEEAVYTSHFYLSIFSMMNNLWSSCMILSFYHSDSVSHCICKYYII